MTEDITRLVTSLKANYPDVRVNIYTYGSYKASLDVTKNGRTMVIECDAEDEDYGATELTPYNGFTRGNDFLFSSIEQVEQFLVSWLTQDNR